MNRQPYTPTRPLSGRYQRLGGASSAAPAGQSDRPEDLLFGQVPPSALPSRPKSPRSTPPS